MIFSNSRSELELQRLEVLNEIIQLILGHVVGDSVLVVRVEARPDFLEGVRPPVVEVGRRLVDVVEMRDVEDIVGVELRTGANRDLLPIGEIGFLLSSEFRVPGSKLGPAILTTPETG